MGRTDVNAQTAPEAFLALTRALAEHAGRVPCTGDDRFHDDDRKVRAQVLNHCADCPVLAPCHTYAEVADERWGVWGGTDRTRHPGSYRKGAA